MVVKLIKVVSAGLGAGGKDVFTIIELVVTTSLVLDVYDSGGGERVVK